MINITSWRRMDVMKLVLGVISIGVAFLLFNIAPAEAASTASASSSKGIALSAIAKVKQEAKDLPSGQEDTALAKFTLIKKGEDRYLNQVVLHVRPKLKNEVKYPWEAFPKLSLWIDGYELGQIDTSDKSMWREFKGPKGNPNYALVAFSGNIKIPAGKSITAIVAADNEAEVGDAWVMWVPKGGVTLWSAKTKKHTKFGPSAVMEYKITGNAGSDASAYIDLKDVEVGKNDNGDWATFSYVVEVTADEGDVYVPNQVGRGPKDGGFVYMINGPSEKNLSASLSSTAEKEGNNYLIKEGETEEITVTIGKVADISGNYSTQLTHLNYRVDSPTSKLVQFALTPAKDRTSPKVALISASSTGSTTKAIKSKTTLKSKTTSGEVKGVSIDVYSQIGATIEALLGHFRSLEANTK